MDNNNFTAKKSLGQNFLMHARIAERIADAAMLTKDATVLEIGPGTGKLTRALLARAKKVVAVEADHELIPVLSETFADEVREGRLELIEADIRSFDPSSLKGPYALVANIPYYITGEIIRTFLSATHKPTSMTLLVQKEVAERVARSKKESLLSLSVKAYGVPKYQFTVPRGAFMPAPNVDSAVLSIFDIHADAFPSKAAEEGFFSILHAGFAHKRKLLLRNLEEVATPERIRSAFASATLPEKARSEDLSLSDWQKLAQELSG
jgi:16S rRNA (adenine1518-N6/adenine1519-N6)-dimethyltransferase